MTDPTPAALAALDELERLALEARSAQERSERQPITTNQIACDEACQALERACSPDVILALLAAARQGEEDTTRLDVLDTIEDAKLEQRDLNGDTRTLWWRMATHLRERGYTNPLNRPIRDFLDEYRAARAASQPSTTENADAKD